MMIPVPFLMKRENTSVGLLSTPVCDTVINADRIVKLAIIVSVDVRILRDAVSLSDSWM